METSAVQVLGVLVIGAILLVVGGLLLVDHNAPILLAAVLIWIGVLITATSPLIVDRWTNGWTNPQNGNESEKKATAPGRSTGEGK